MDRISYPCDMRPHHEGMKMVKVGRAKNIEATKIEVVKSNDRKSERKRERTWQGDGDGNAVSVMVDGRV